MCSICCALKSRGMHSHGQSFLAAQTLIFVLLPYGSESCMAVQISTECRPVSRGGQGVTEAKYGNPVSSEELRLCPSWQLDCLNRLGLRRSGRTSPRSLRSTRRLTVTLIKQSLAVLLVFSLALAT